MIQPLNGLIPPQDLDIENQVLGASMLYAQVADQVAALPSDLFYKPINQTVHSAITHLVTKNTRIDVLTIKDILKKWNQLEYVGGAFYLADLTGTVVNTANTDSHIAILREKHASRKLINECTEVTKDLYQTHNAAEAIERIEKTTFDILTENESRSGRPMHDVGIELLELLEKRMATDGSVMGIPSGIGNLDKLTGGWIEPELVLVGARPAMGKTDFALNLVINASMQFGYKAALISLEMSDTQLMERALAIYTGINKTALREGDRSLLEVDGGTNPVVTNAILDLMKAGPQLIDMGSAKFVDIKRKCRELVLGGVELIVIDYLGLISADVKYGQNKNHAVGEISRGLKMQVCKEMRVPVIALHQLSRAVETRGGDKRPILSDLRDSGELEQDADKVIFLYRPEYYGFEVDDEGNHTNGLIEYIFAKNRQGPTGTLKGLYNTSIGKHERWSIPTGSTPF